MPPALFPVFPTARTELIFHFGDAFRVGDTGSRLRTLPPAALLGPRARAYWQAAGPRIDWFLIQLTPLGCRRLLGLSMAESWHGEIALADLWGPAAEALHERLRHAGTFGARAQIAIAALQARAAPDAIDPLSHIVTLARDGHVRSIAQFAQSLGVGDRRLHQKFAAQVGIRPKLFLRLMRFGRQLQARHPLAGSLDMDEPEYADDSHAIREFRHFAGSTPGAYARGKQRDHLIFTGPQIRLPACGRIPADEPVPPT